MSGFVGAILAGGRGRRMGSLGEHYPKALLPVANQPLIAHHLGLLRRVGVQEVFVVVGYRANDVVDAIGDGYGLGLTVRYVEQGGTLGSAHALGRLRPHVHGPIVVILGDYYLSLVDPVPLVSHLQDGRSSAIAARREPQPRLLSEACELGVDESGRVARIVEKPVRPAGDLKGCGFYALQPDVFDAIARTPRTALRDEYELTVALELFIDAGHPLYAEEVIDWDQNFTSPQDVLECNLQWLARNNRQELIGEGAQVAPGARLERTVVGHGARIEHGSSLREVVVFDGTTFGGGGSVCRALVTRRGLHVFTDEPAVSRPPDAPAPLGPKGEMP